MSKDEGTVLHVMAFYEKVKPGRKFIWWTEFLTRLEEDEGQLHGVVHAAMKATDEANK